MTRNEAVERAQKIWSGVTILEIIEAPNTWTVSVMDGIQVSHHSLDRNGHAVCHGPCAMREASMSDEEMRYISVSSIVFKRTEKGKWERGVVINQDQLIIDMDGKVVDGALWSWKVPNSVSTMNEFDFPMDDNGNRLSRSKRQS